MPVASDCQYLFPAKVVSRLVKWVTIAHEDYMVGRGVTGHCAVLGTADPWSSLSSCPSAIRAMDLTRGARSSLLVRDDF